MAMKGRRFGWIAGGAGAVLLMGAVIYVISDLTAGNRDRPVFSREWELCDSADVCVAVPAPCGEWQPVNQRHEQDAAAYYGHLITVVEEAEMVCMSVNLSTRRPQAFCVSGVCGLAQ